MIKHESMRGYFSYELYQEMNKDDNIWLLTGDLGYKIFDNHFLTFPGRCINTGAAEQALVGISVGLALSGKIPIVYSITPFLLYRPFETIRTYINHEKIPVKLVGSGRDNDYMHDGYSHDASDAMQILNTLSAIKQYYPQEKKDITAEYMREFIYNEDPCFLSLRR